MFSAIGTQLKKQNIIQDSKDIFYLELEELLNLDTKNYTQLVHQIRIRKASFGAYKLQPSPQERFYTYGHNFNDKYIYSEEKVEPVVGDLQGIGCCPGQVRARVQLIENPESIDSLNGDILVTKSTDPGWVTLFPSASAIIVERGSLLSHSAIVSREMGIPCIVSVDGLLRTLKTGDEVLIDGSTGTIKILNKEKH
jgi:pyruvate,water dikinase